MVGLNTTEKAMFNSNREKSPAEGDVTQQKQYYGATEAGRQPTPASGRRAQAAGGAANHGHVQQQPLVPGTGETGMQLGGDGAEGADTATDGTTTRASSREQEHRSRTGNNDYNRESSPRRSNAEEGANGRVLQA